MGTRCLSASAKIRLAVRRSGAKVLSTYVGFPKGNTCSHSSRCVSGVEGASTMKQSTASFNPSALENQATPFASAHFLPALGRNPVHPATTKPLCFSSFRSSFR